MIVFLCVIIKILRFQIKTWLHTCFKTAHWDCWGCHFNQINQPKNPKIDRSADKLNPSKMSPHQWTHHASSTPFHQCHPQDSTELHPPAKWAFVAPSTHSIKIIWESSFFHFGFGFWTAADSLHSIWTSAQGIDVLMIAESVFIGSVKMSISSSTLF